MLKIEIIHLVFLEGNLCLLISGAFLIPYIIMLILCGMPMFYMELAVGQYFSLGPIGTWGAVCPLFQGKVNQALYCIHCILSWHFKGVYFYTVCPVQGQVLFEHLVV